MVRQAGFTLLELMITLVIVSASTAIILAQIQGFTGQRIQVEEHYSAATAGLNTLTRFKLYSSEIQDVELRDDRLQAALSVDNQPEIVLDVFNYEAGFTREQLRREKEAAELAGGAVSQAVPAVSEQRERWASVPVTKAHTANQLYVLDGELGYRASLLLPALPPP
ncbi:type II secretion system protein [Aliamphritea hakodatensis]|uniref:type II secretion system protein n=1 Tax=Aliamphritea hakodatensis TaxID=2895352 RepID=UPI0022FD7D91|nr:type II secretion system protein [Aliamphritea hakodatensis]